jgi:hypothetical protein
VKSRVTLALLFASLVLNATLGAALLRGPGADARADAGEAEELAPYMALLQHHTHKLGLAVQAKNQALAAFYLEEVEETTREIEKRFPTYDGVAIGELAEAMLLPSVEPVEKAIQGASWPAAAGAYGKLVGACNDCHAAANHDFIEITVPAGNPFNQSFSTPGTR